MANLLDVLAPRRRERRRLTNLLEQHRRRQRLAYSDRYNPDTTACSISAPENPAGQCTRVEGVCLLLARAQVDAEDRRALGLGRQVNEEDRAAAVDALKGRA